MPSLILSLSSEQPGTPFPGGSVLGDLRAARTSLAKWGSDGLTYLSLRDGSEVLVSPDNKACLAFVRSGGMAVSIGAPSGPPESTTGLIERFESACRVEGTRPVFCGVPETVALALASRGYRVASVGDEAVIDPAGVDLHGARWRETRAALNRARRYGLIFRWLSPAERTHTLVGQLGEVSRAWLRGKRVPELRFALGSVESLTDPAVRVAVAVTKAGRIEGFVTWVPVPARAGWMLELLRRRSGAIAGLSDFLVASSLLTFRREGVRYASLSGTPLANVARRQSAAMRLALLALCAPARSWYDPEGLRHFKDKFNPVWCQLYLAYTGPAGLPRAMLAIGRACLPPLSVWSLVRGPMALASSVVRGLRAEDLGRVSH